MHRSKPQPCSRNGSKSAVLAMLLVPLAPTIQAQEAEFVLEEVIVTAQRREQSLQNVPMAVSVLRADMLKQTGARILTDISQLVPGLTITDTPTDQEVSIRGIQSNDVSWVNEQSIPMYLDGVYLGLGNQMVRDLNDIARMEVLKGPQGTLFGRNASGGALSITTNPVAPGFEGNVGLGLGNHGLVTADGAVNVPLVDNTLGMRLSGALRQRDGWHENILTGSDDGRELDRWYVRAKFLWTPTDTVAVELTGDYTKDDDHAGYLYSQENTYGSPVFDLDGGKAAVGQENFFTGEPEAEPPSYSSERETSGLVANVTWDINEMLMLTSISAYRDLDGSTSQDIDGTEYLIFHQDSRQDADEYSQEFRLSGTTDSTDWFIGVSYYELDSNGNFIATLGSGFAGLFTHEISDTDNSTKSYGVFSDMIWEATDKLNLTLGARYSYDEKTQDIHTACNQSSLGFNLLMPCVDQLTDSEGNPDPSLASLKEDWDDVSLRGVVDYQIFENGMVFLSIAQGHKAGGFNSFPIVDFGDFFPFASPGQLEPFDPETVINYELGAKLELFERRLRLNGSLFYYDWDDLQVLISEGATIAIINAGEAEGYGADMDLTFQASDNLALFARLGWLEAEFKKDVPGSVIREGETLPYAPEFSVAIGLNHFATLTDRLTLRTNISYTYTDDQIVALERPDSYLRESHELLNARLSLLTMDGRWELAAWGRNLTDEVYQEVLADFSVLGALSALPNVPRTYGVELRYGF